VLTDGWLKPVREKVMSISQEQVGLMFLSLVACGETESLSWKDLDLATRLRIDQRSVQADCLINDALDDMLRRYCR